MSRKGPREPRRRHGDPPTPECIVLSGGISGADTHAIAGSLIWEKGRREKLGEFIERAKGEARANGERILIVKGLKW